MTESRYLNCQQGVADIKLQTKGLTAGEVEEQAKQAAWPRSK